MGNQSILYSCIALRTGVVPRYRFEILHGAQGMVGLLRASSRLFRKQPVEESAGFDGLIPMVRLITLHNLTYMKLLFLCSAR